MVQIRGSKVITENDPRATGAWGYDLGSLLYAIGWIIEQEYIYFRGRPLKKREEINKTLGVSCMEALPESERS